MNEIQNRLNVELVEPIQKNSDSNLINLINERIKPSEILTENDVCIRAMFIVSDQINSYGGRFPVEEHKHLTSLLIDSPVLVGHRKDTLPIGRSFHAELITRDGKNWIKNYFYWLKNVEGADDLRENIDGGIFKECSIGFSFLTAECSICGKDIRECEHIPRETYIIDDTEHICYYNYRNIQKVLETSLVYRGANPDTAITNDLIIAKTPSHDRNNEIVIENLSELDKEATYLVVPSYDGIDIFLKSNSGVIKAWRTDGRKVDLKCFGKISSRGSSKKTLFGRLVGFRGKERCPEHQTDNFLNHKDSPVTRLVLFVYPSESNSLEIVNDPSAFNRIQMIRHSFVKHEQIDETSETLMTRDGVEIISENSYPHHFRYKTHNIEREVSGNFARLTKAPGSPNAYLEFAFDNTKRLFIIHQFQPAQFRMGRRFIADEISQSEMRCKRKKENDNLIALKEVKIQKNRFILNGEEYGIVIAPIKLDDKRRFLLWRVSINDN